MRWPFIMIFLLGASALSAQVRQVLAPTEQALAPIEQDPPSGGDVLPPISIPFGSNGYYTDVQRFFSPVVGKHFWTNIYSEASSLYSNYIAHMYGLGVTGPSDWKWEGTAWASAGLAPVYRLRNGSSHFYTMSASEASTATQNGWTPEGTCGTLEPNFTGIGYGSLVPVYRLWDGGNDHLYTININERNTCLSQGWRDEGILGYGRRI